MSQTQALSFSSVATIFRKHIAKNLYGNLPSLLSKIFHSYAETDPVGFDSASVSRWLSGSSPVRAAVAIFYLTPDHEGLLADDIFRYVLPLTADTGVIALELYALVSTAENISTHQRARLASRFSLENDAAIAAFVSEVVLCTLKSVSQTSTD